MDGFGKFENWFYNMIFLSTVLSNSKSSIFYCKVLGEIERSLVVNKA
jgi:hypothetical protein